MINPKLIKLFQVAPGEKVRLKQRDTGWAQTAEMKELGKDVVKGRAETDPGREHCAPHGGARAPLRQ